MICPNCHTENAEDAELCSKCGAALSGVETAVREPSLTGRGARLGAKVIDALVLVLVAFLGIVLAQVADVLVILVPLGLLAIVILQVVWLTRHGQTIGKKALNMRIVSVETGRNAGFVKNVVLRAWVTFLLGVIPLFGLVHVLFIFREDRRCIHDLIAGTRVVPA